MISAHAEIRGKETLQNRKNKHNYDNTHPVLFRWICKVKSCNVLVGGFGADVTIVMIFTNIIMDYVFDEIQHDKHYE
jgi:hypothetical protein